MGLVVDLFAGGGGASVGIEAALGRPVDLAINHSATALAVHERNHPRTRHLKSDIWDVQPRDAVGSNRVSFLWASPDCFPAGTMILTEGGYRPIEEIAVGDEVLTHRNRWRKVTSIYRSMKPLMRLKGHGHPGILVSGEHPFLARPFNRNWHNDTRSYQRSLGKQGWVNAKDLDRGWYWASPVNFPSAEVPTIGAGDRSLAITPEVMWLVGRYLADGWTRLTETRAELVITCGHHKTELLREHINKWKRAGSRAGSDEITWHERDTQTAHQFSTSFRALVEWLREHFGHGAAEKRIPGWALGMSSDLRAELLAGYLAGDGYRSGNLVQTSTVSKALAFGLKALIGSLGHTPTVYYRQPQHQNQFIEGRRVNVRPSWAVRFREELDSDHVQTFRDEGYEWSAVKGRDEDVSAEDVEVFNFSVDEDESYVAEGIVTHNCTHFSNAKGDVPRAQNIRSLAWVVVKWAKQVKPDVIMLENVQEFRGWGPLGEDGRPIKARMGETFKRWRKALEREGYVVDYRILNAADAGAPTRRKRLFLIARSDGRPIVWPDLSHAGGPYHTAAECIDWSLPCPSIFERKKPYAEKTLWRIAQGIKRFVIDNPRPFIIKVNHGKWEARVEDLLDPLTTVTAKRRGHGIVIPVLQQSGYGERPTQKARVLDLNDPLGTVVACGQKHALVSAMLLKHYGDPLRESGGGAVIGSDLREPTGTVTTRDHHSLAAVTLAHFRGTHPSQPGSASVEQPMPTITSGGGRGGIHVAEVRAYLTKYYTTGTSFGQSLHDPMHTVTTRDTFGLVTVSGVDYQIVDIGMRMLQPHELLKAQFGRFAESYDISPARTKAAKVKLIGNSVCPELVEQIVRANVPAYLERSVA